MVSTIDNKSRISSIDALRALALLGIIIVHANDGFNVRVECNSSVDYFLKSIVDTFLSQRCACIFTILFGVSFYLVLRKDNYPSTKFVWRCILLMLIGLFNKIFYWPDALTYYGFCGILLVPIRRIKTPYILLVSAMLFILTDICRHLELDMLIPNHYTDGLYYVNKPSLRYVLFLWSKGVFQYCRIVLDKGIFGCLANMTLGYWLGRVGFIEKMDKKINKIYLIVSFVCFIVGMLIYNFINNSSYVIFLFWKFSCSIFYSVLFIYIYNRAHKLRILYKYMESYGKLGLTNYSFQGIIAMTLLSYCGFGFIGLSVSNLIVLSILFFILQAIFSKIWLSYFRNGPMEWVWRCVTERKLLPILKSSF